MEEKNKFLNFALAGLVCAFVAISLVFCVSLAIRMALAPMVQVLKESARISARVTALEAEVNRLKQQPVGRQALPPVPQEDYTTVYDVHVGDSYALGKPDARITIVEFSDFQCPFCAKFHPVLHDVQQAFPDDVRLVLKNYPLAFHPNARPAARAAFAAGIQGKYFEMVALLMANAADLSGAKYVELAGKLGLNVEQFSRDLKDREAEFDKKIDADSALGDKVDVKGTPTYFINGRKTRARDIKQWTAEVEALLKK